jgi:hypothetical protein
MTVERLTSLMMVLLKSRPASEPCLVLAVPLLVPLAGHKSMAYATRQYMVRFTAKPGMAAIRRANEATLQLHDAFRPRTNQISNEGWVTQWCEFRLFLG